VEVINTELALADLAAVEKALMKNNKTVKSGNKTAIAEKSILQRLQDQLNAGLPIRQMTLNEAENLFVKRLFLLTAKPVLYIANVAENGFDNNLYLDQVQQYAKQEGSPTVAICANIEADIATLSDEEKTEFLQELGLTEAGLDRLIHAGYQLLNLQTYFTAGKKEVRAWTTPKDALAPQAAGVIHTDFEKGFIRAEVVSYEDFIHHHGEQGAKEVGKLRLEGKEYKVQDGDIMHFRFNV